jgi:hypothetical protein
MKRRSVNRSRCQAASRIIAFGIFIRLFFLRLFKKFFPAITILHFSAGTTGNARGIIFRMRWSDEQERT